MAESKLKTGTCIFCGQTQQLEVMCDADEEKLNHIATMKCNCEGAVHYQNIQEVSEEIDKAWGKDMPEAAALAKAAVAYIDKGALQSVNINTGMCVKIKVSANSKGEISVVSTESHSNVISV